MNLYEHTGLGRPLLMRYRSNRIAVAGTLLAGIVAVAVRWFASSEIDLFASGSTAVGVFLAWAIARELDPDRPSTATIAMVLAGAIAFAGPTSAGVAAAVLIALRLMVGTVGTPVQPVDLVVVVAAAGYAGTRPEGWPAVLLLAAAMAFVHPPRHQLVQAGIFSAAVVGAIVTGASAGFGSWGALSVALAMIAVVAAVVATPVQSVSATTDVGKKPLSSARITRARLVTGLAVVAAALLATNGAVALSPLVGGLVAVAIASVRSYERVLVEARA